MKTVVRWTGDRPPPVDGRKALPPTTDFYDSKGSLERMRQGADEIEAQYKKYPRDAQVRVRDWGGASAAITKPKPQGALTANKLFVSFYFVIVSSSPTHLVTGGSTHKYLYCLVALKVMQQHFA